MTDGAPHRPLLPADLLPGAAHPPDRGPAAAGPRRGAAPLARLGARRAGRASSRSARAHPSSRRSRRRRQEQAASSSETGPPGSSPPPRRLAGTFALGQAIGILDWPIRLVVVPVAVATLADPGDARRPPSGALRRLLARAAAGAADGARSGAALPAHGDAAGSSAASSGSRPTPTAPACGARRITGPAVVHLRRADRGAPPSRSGRRAGRRDGRGDRRPPPALRPRSSSTRRDPRGAAVIRFPLRYARANVLVGPGGEAAALYRVGTLSYPCLPAQEKWGLLHRLERLVAVRRRRPLDLAGRPLLSGRPLRRRAGLAGRPGPRRPRSAGAPTWRPSRSSSPGSTPTSPRSTWRSP